MRRTVFLGNCQAEALAKIYRERFADPETNDIRVVIVSSGMNRRAQDWLAAADTVVVQILDQPTHDPFLPFCSSARKVFVPLVTGSFMWPGCGVTHPEYTSSRVTPATLFDREMGNRQLNKLLASSRAPDDVLHDYLALDYGDEVDLDWLLDYTTERQAMRDERCDFPTASFIRNGFRRERLFITPDHMHLNMFRFVARLLYPRLGEPVAFVDRVLDNITRTPFSTRETPIHPSVARHFGIEYIGPSTRYEMIGGQRLTFEEFVRQYVCLDTSEAILRFVEIGRTAGRRLNVDEIAELSAAFSATPTAQGYARLAAESATLGKPNDAIKFYERAAALDPANPSIAVPCAQQMLKVGLIDRARAVLSDLVAWGCATAPVFEMLGHVERQAKDIPLALEHFGRSLIKDPRNRNVRALVNALSGK